MNACTFMCTMCVTVCLCVDVCACAHACSMCVYACPKIRIFVFKFNFIADVIQLHSPKIEASNQQPQQQQEEIEDIVMDEGSHHVEDSPEKL